MFTRLPLDVRLLIWETMLEPRIAHIKMRHLPSLDFGNRTEDKDCFCGNTIPDDGKEYETYSPTPVPILLHICSETRTLALDYYELTFGRPLPSYPKTHSEVRHMYNTIFAGWSNRPPGDPSDPVINEAIDPSQKHAAKVESCASSYPSTATELAEDAAGFRIYHAQVVLYAPKIYFNFHHDIAVFDVHFFSQGYKPTHLYSFPDTRHLDIDTIGRIENLILELPEIHGDYLFSILSRLISEGKFQNLRSLALCLDTTTIEDVKAGIELVDLRRRVREEDVLVAEVALEFIEKWYSSFPQQRLLAELRGKGGVEIIWNDVLKVRRWADLRAHLIRNGARVDAVVGSVLLRGESSDQ